MSENATSYFVRQRRSLILISMVFSVVAAFGITGTEVRVGPGGGTGLVIDLLDRRFIYLALFFMWAWFLYRYLQYFVQTRATEIDKLRTIQYQAIKDSAEEILAKKARKSIDKILVQRWPDGNFVVDDDLHILGRVSRSNWQHIGATYSLIARPVPINLPKAPETISSTETITGLRLYWFLFAKTFWPTLRHSYFSEYTMPLILAAIPIFIVAFNWREVFLPSPGSPVSIVGPF